MSTFPMLDALTKKWWVLLVRGILALLFGILAFTLPGLTVQVLVVVFGIYALADGLTAVWVGGTLRMWALVIVGILGIAAGVLALIYPEITAVALLYLIAAWAIVLGVFELVTSIEFRTIISDEWAFILGGILSVILGVVLILEPAAGVLAMVWVIGAYALIFGVIMIILAFRIHELPGRLEKTV